jgi:protein-tyrosine phosphatase
MMYKLLLFAALASSARAAGQPRSMELEGAPNFRDIGGYATDDGKHVKWGRVFRSNTLGKLTPADAKRVGELHLAAVVDLRTEEERKQSPDVWNERPKDVYESPKDTLAPVMRVVLRGAGTADGARAGIREFYSRMPDEYRSEYAAFFHRIAAGDVPILVHCTAGKDRTGVAIAVLLRSVGVSRETAVADYQLTDHFVPASSMVKHSAAPIGAAAQGTLESLPEESRLALWQSSPDYIGAAFDSIDREYGSVDAYLTRGLGLTGAELTAIRHNLTQ